MVVDSHQSPHDCDCGCTAKLWAKLMPHSHVAGLSHLTVSMLRICLTHLGMAQPRVLCLPSGQSMSCDD